MEKIILIGAGPMAISYAEVLLAKNKTFIVVGRGEESSKTFEKQTGVSPFRGGLEAFLGSNDVAGALAIVATGTETLLASTLALLDAGVSRILVEKPAALSIRQLFDSEFKLSEFSERVYVAYNRRFYASVFETQRLVNEDGGLLTLNFEFTEWAHKIAPLVKAAGVKENWFFANSTHVIDLAFFLAGKPKDWGAYSKAGTLDWHEKSNFVGAGTTEKDILFSYMSNWESAGRWGIEVLTANRRIYLRPMEELFIQNKGSIQIEEHKFDDSLDKAFKPGVYKQLEAFLMGNDSRLLNVRDHLIMCKIYEKMLGVKSA